MTFMHHLKLKQDLISIKVLAQVLLSVVTGLNNQGKSSMLTKLLVPCEDVDLIGEIKAKNIKK